MVFEYRVIRNHPTVVVDTIVVTADTEEEAIDKAKNGEYLWERQEEDTFGLCHQCEDNDEYSASIEG